MESDCANWWTLKPLKSIGCARSQTVTSNPSAMYAVSETKSNVPSALPYRTYKRFEGEEMDTEDRELLVEVAGILRSEVYDELAGAVEELISKLDLDDEPAPGSVEVRVAVCVGPDGMWDASGYSSGGKPADNIEKLLEESLELGDAVYWLSAFVQKPIEDVPVIPATVSEVSK
jgi:hypothetical protein